MFVEPSAIGDVATAVVVALGSPVLLLTKQAPTIIAPAVATTTVATAEVPLPEEPLTVPLASGATFLTPLKAITPTEFFKLAAPHVPVTV